MYIGQYEETQYGLLVYNVTCALLALNLLSWPMLFIEDKGFGRPLF